MANLNRVLLAGRLTRDPKLSQTAGGRSVAELGLAVNRTVRGGEGQAAREETTFVDITCWGPLAETANQALRKGMPVFVEGRLQLDQWEKDGKKFSKLRVVAERVQAMTDDQLRRPPRGGAEQEDDGGGGFGAEPAPDDDN